MVPANKNLILVFDLETTGLPPKKTKATPENISLFNSSRIVSIAMCWFTVTNHIKVYEKYSLIKPENFQITNMQYNGGITTEQATTEGISFDEYFHDPCLLQYFQNSKILVSHNLEFDENVLLSEFYRRNLLNLQILLLSIPIRYCTMKMGKIALKLVKFPKLIELWRNLIKKPEATFNQHNALADAQICGECYHYLNPVI